MRLRGMRIPDLELRLRRDEVTVHVGELTSEVVTEPEVGTSAQAQGSDGWTWDELEKQEELIARLHSDRMRTSAEGFDD
jgi:hypothetical protein